MKRFAFLFISVVCLLSATAQSDSIVRIGYLNREAIVAELPQTKHLEKELDEQKNLFEKEYTIMQYEYNQKVKAYIENNKSMSEPIKLARQAEITEYEERLALYSQRYRKLLADQRAAGMNSINATMNNAISSVAQQLHLTIVFDQQTPLYTNSSCVDITDDVKQELGL